MPTHKPPRDVQLSLEKRLEQLMADLEKMLAIPPIPAIPAIPAIPPIPANSVDHDLLLRIDTKVERVINDVAKLNDNYSGRIEALEHSKQDGLDYEKGHLDHEGRLRDIEKFRENLTGKLSILAGGISMVVTLIFSLLIKKVGG